MSSKHTLYFSLVPSPRAPSNNDELFLWTMPWSWALHVFWNREQMMWPLLVPQPLFKARLLGGSMHIKNGEVEFGREGGWAREGTINEVQVLTSNHIKWSFLLTHSHIGCDEWFLTQCRTLFPSPKQVPYWELLHVAWSGWSVEQVWWTLATWPLTLSEFVGRYMFIHRYMQQLK